MSEKTYNVGAENEALQPVNCDNEGALTQAIYNFKGLTEVDLRAVYYLNNVTIEGLEADESLIIDSGLNQVDQLNDLGMKDKFMSGMYGRALFIPKNTFLTGKIHKRPYMDILAYGDVSVMSFFEDGSREEVERVNTHTGHWFEGKEGRKRVLFTHSNCLWVTVDPTEAKIKEDVENDVIFDTMTDYRNVLELAA